MQCNGDPNCLRDMTWDAARKGFSQVGDASPDSSTDVNGILLGRKEAGGGKWTVTSGYGDYYLANDFGSNRLLVYNDGSTVSRAVANKYVHTPQGVFELRYFFSEAVQGPSGSATPLLIVKRRVKKMIEDENASHPLTDEQITHRLHSE